MSDREMMQEILRSKERSFDDVLRSVQAHMTKYYSSVLKDSKANEYEQVQKNYIAKYISDNRIEVSGYKPDELVDELYSAMSEYYFLTPYLKSKDVEEININGFDDIEVYFRDSRLEKLDKSFSSPQQALDIIKRMLEPSNMVLDGSQPMVRGHLLHLGNIRITAECPPVIDEDRGATASIRIVNPNKYTMEDFIRFGTLPKQMAEEMLILSKHKVSIAVAGDTGSGKTTFLDGLINQLAELRLRIITIEEDVREFSSIRKKDGKIYTSVVHMVTKKADNPKDSVDQEKLLEYALTMHPKIIVVGEMKSSEAYAAQEAARTGHGVLTSIHSTDSFATHARMVTLCKMKYDMNDKTLQDNVSDAFPIIVYLKQMEDYQRKVVEVTECVNEDGKRRYVPLWEYVVDEIVEDANGEKKVVGAFRKVNNISEKLQRRLKQNGIAKNELQTMLSNYVEES